MKIPKKALILVDHGSKLDEANNLLVDIVNEIIQLDNNKFDFIEHCHMELASPTIKEAYTRCVEQGANEIIVHPYFLAPGRHSTIDIPRMVSEVAREFPGISYKISEPLGFDSKIIEVILKRAYSC